MPEYDDRREGDHVVRQANVEIPEREPDEDPITANQLRYIRKLAPDIEIEGGLESLGKWQASWLIDQIKADKEQLEDEVAAGLHRSKGGCLSVLAMFLVVAGHALLLVA